MKRILAALALCAFMAFPAQAQSPTAFCDDTGRNCARVSPSNPLPVTPGASAEGGATPGFIITAATSNPTVIKDSPGTLYSFTVTTTAANVDTIRFYDSATIVPCGTAPKLTYRIPSGSGGAVLANPVPAVGITFLAGIMTSIATGSVVSHCGAAQAGAEVSYSFK